MTTGIYVYGLVPADATVDAGIKGVGEPPRPVRLIPHGDIAALASEVDVDEPLGRPEDLIAHERVLDEVAATAPVVPIRFGSVLRTEDAVVEQLLEPYHDDFRSTMDDLRGRAEYLMRARYAEEPMLREIMRGDPELERVRQQLRDEPEELTRDARIALGERIGAEIAVRRDRDTAVIVDRLSPHAISVLVREPTHELDAANVAVLADTDREADLITALDELAAENSDRLQVQMRGPLAPYDFVTTLRQGA